MVNDEMDFADDESSDDPSLETEAEVSCPHCGETLVIALDPAGGVSQEYFEDCEVCCRPWRVRVTYTARGGAEVELQALE